MLKIPHVGSPLGTFMFNTSIQNSKVQVAINYMLPNANGVPTMRVFAFELWTDTRHPNLNQIQIDVDAFLNNSQGTHSGTIRIDEPRLYIHCDFEQYSGKEI